MRCRKTMRRLLAIMMIAGLVLAPFARPTMAAVDSHASISAEADHMPAMSGTMADDMPCCPSKAPAPADCDKCVFMAACMSKCFTGITTAFFQPSFGASISRLQPLSDFWPDGLGHPPPEDPPRHLI